MKICLYSFLHDLGTLLEERNTGHNHNIGNNFVVGSCKGYGSTVDLVGNFVDSKVAQENIASALRNLASHQFYHKKKSQRKKSHSRKI